MGHGTRPGNLGHTIGTFWPDEDEKSFYISDSATLKDIMERAAEKWPLLQQDQLIGRLSIDAEHIHTDCLGYDRYDGTDWTNFLHITLRET